MIDWKSDLDSFFAKEKEAELKGEKSQIEIKSEISKFFQTVVLPAFQELKQQIEKNDYEIDIYESSNQESASIRMRAKGAKKIEYTIKVNVFPSHIHPYVETKTYISGQAFPGTSALGSSSNDSIHTITRQNIIESFVRIYKSLVERN